jgi:hypothetical protein
VTPLRRGFFIHPTATIRLPTSLSSVDVKGFKSMAPSAGSPTSLIRGHLSASHPLNEERFMKNDLQHSTYDSAARRKWRASVASRTPPAASPPIRSS